MEYKIISTDFDGTLLTSDKKVTKRNKSALLNYKSNKYIIIGISARNLSSVKNTCDLKMFNYLVLNNGSYVYNVEKSNGKYVDVIDNEDAKKITNYFDNLARAIDFCGVNKYYRYKEAVTKTKSDTAQVKSIEEVDEPICRINIFANNNDEIATYKKYIDENFNMVDAIIMQDTDSISNEKWITLNPKGLNKFSSLKKLCQQLNINSNEVIFFGDGLNDLEIIQGVGLGVAMKNAVPEVKEKAKAVTLSNDEDGVADFLEKLQLT